jgi:hypothetical protein
MTKNKLIILSFIVFIVTPIIYLVYHYKGNDISSEIYRNLHPNEPEWYHNDCTGFTILIIPPLFVLGWILAISSVILYRRTRNVEFFKLSEWDQAIYVIIYTMGILYFTIGIIFLTWFLSLIFQLHKMM